MEFKIDASNKILGRLASEVAFLLRGKETARFNPRRLSENRVVVFNTDKIRVTGKKREQKLYRRHSGYHGGLKEATFEEVYAKDSRLPLRYAVMGMLPKNKLRAKMIKNLILKKSKE